MIILFSIKTSTRRLQKSICDEITNREFCRCVKPASESYSGSIRS